MKPVALTVTPSCYSYGNELTLNWREKKHTEATKNDKTQKNQIGLRKGFVLKDILRYDVKICIMLANQRFSSRKFHYCRHCWWKVLQFLIWHHSRLNEFVRPNGTSEVAIGSFERLSFTRRTFKGQQEAGNRLERRQWFAGCSDKDAATGLVVPWRQVSCDEQRWLLRSEQTRVAR